MGEIYPRTLEERRIFDSVTAGNCPDCFHPGCLELVNLALRVIEVRRRA